MFRKKKRTMLIMSAVIICVMVMQFFSGFMNGMKNDILRDLENSSGHIQIKHKKLVEYVGGNLPSEYPISGIDHIEETLLDNTHIKAIYKFIDFGAFLVHEREKAGTEDKPQMPVMISGFEVEEESVHKQFRDGIRKGGRFLENPDEVVIGYKIAYTLDIKLNDEVQIMTMRPNSGLYYKNFKVVGFFQTMVSQLDQGMALMSFEDAADMVDYSNQATSLSIVLDNSSLAQEISEQIQDQLDTELKSTSQITLQVEPTPGILIEDTPEGSRGEPAIVLRATADSIKKLATVNSALNPIEESIQDNTHDSVWIVGDTKPQRVTVAWSDDMGMTKETWNVDGVIPPENIGLDKGTILYVSAPSTESKSDLENPDADPFAQLLATESVQSDLIAAGVDVEKLRMQSLDLLSSQQTAIEKFMTFEENQEITSQSWQEYNSSILDMLNLSDTMTFYVFFIFAIAVAAIIINNVLIGVFERIREIGTLRAIGWGRFQTLGLIEVEALFIGVVGSLIGLVVGSSIVMLLGYTGIDMGQSMDVLPGLSTILRPAIDLKGSLRAFFLGVLLVVLIAMIPAIIAAKMHPIKALGFSQ